MATSIREALESAVSSQEAKESTVAALVETPVVETAPVEAVQPAAAEVPIGETDAQRTERLRDEKGRFTEGKAAPAKVEPVQATATPAPVVAKLPKPDSWKKEWQSEWDALTPKQQEIAKLREDQYFKGVSTYKQEWDGAKPLLDAVAPFLPDLQKHNIKPEQWISNLGRAHQVLATGAPHERLNAFNKLAQDYLGVPLQSLADPQWQQQFMQQVLMQQQAQPAQQVDVAALVKQELSAARTQDAIEQFQAAKDAAGQPQYPHFETVKADMALLLDAGKAQDLKSAYGMALRLHDDLFAAEQAAQGKAAEAARLDASRKVVAAAKGSAVSVKSATPASAGAAPKKGIRAQLEEAYDQHAGGRV